MLLSEIASAVWNDIQSGVAGMSANPTMSLEQLEDECSELREVVIKEFYLKNLLSLRDLAFSINCIEVNCADQNKCPKCCSVSVSKPAQHFEIPKLAEGLGASAILYIGSTDHSNPFKFSFSKEAFKFNQYKRRGSEKPFVYIDPTPNANGHLDCWLFNAPFVKYLSVTAVFKNLRDLAEFNCCEDPKFTDFGIISTEVKNRLVKSKLQLYRQYLMPPHQTDISPR